MKKNTGEKTRLLPALIFFGITVLLFISLLIVKTFPEASETISTGFSRWWIGVFGGLSSKVSFSLFEFFIYLCIFVIICFIAFWIYCGVKKRGRAALKSLIVFLIIVFTILNIYTLTASFTYMRKSPDLIYAAEEEPDSQKLYELASYFIEDFNILAENFEKDDSGMFVNPYTVNELNAIFQEEYRKLNSSYLFTYTPPVKEVVSSVLMSELSICGIFFAPTGEANINFDMPAFYIPVTIAHELAHAKGAMQERDANLFAYQICLNSDNDFLRLSGYMSCLSSLLSAVGFVCGEEVYNQLHDSLSEEYFVQWSLYYEYWNKHSSLAKIQEFFNDLYLKLSGVEEGVNNYYIEDEVIIDNNTNEVISFEYNDIQKIFIYIYNEKTKL